MTQGVGGATCSGWNLTMEGGKGKGADLELEGKGREDEGALLLEHLADVVTGGARQRQRHRFPHLASADADPISCGVRLRAGIGGLPSFLLNFF